MLLLNDDVISNNAQNNFKFCNPSPIIRITNIKRRFISENRFFVGLESQEREPQEHWATNLKATPAPFVLRNVILPLHELHFTIELIKVKTNA